MSNVDFREEIESEAGQVVDTVTEDVTADELPPDSEAKHYEERARRMGWYCPGDDIRYICRWD